MKTNMVWLVLVALMMMEPAFAGSLSLTPQGSAAANSWIALAVGIAIPAFILFVVAGGLSAIIHAISGHHGGHLQTFLVTVFAGMFIIGVVMAVQTFGGSMFTGALI
jgi:hypothetical protein